MMSYDDLWSYMASKTFSLKNIPVRCWTSTKTGKYVYKPFGRKRRWRALTVCHRYIKVCDSLRRSDSTRRNQQQSQTRHLTCGESYPDTSSASVPADLESDDGRMSFLLHLLWPLETFLQILLSLLEIGTVFVHVHTVLAKLKSQTVLLGVLIWKILAYMHLSNFKECEGHNINIIYLLHFCLSYSNKEWLKHSRELMKLTFCCFGQ